MYKSLDQSIQRGGDIFRSFLYDLKITFQSALHPKRAFLILKKRNRFDLILRILPSNIFYSHRNDVLNCKESLFLCCQQLIDFRIAISVMEMSKKSAIYHSFSRQGIPQKPITLLRFSKTCQFYCKYYQSKNIKQEQYNIGRLQKRRSLVIQ